LERSGGTVLTEASPWTAPTDASSGEGEVEAGELEQAASATAAAKGRRVTDPRSV
jgi:hypothetical protein